MLCSLVLSSVFVWGVISCSRWHHLNWSIKHFDRLASPSSFPRGFEEQVQGCCRGVDSRVLPGKPEGGGALDVVATASPRKVFTRRYTRLKASSAASHESITYFYTLIPIRDLPLDTSQCVALLMSIDMNFNSRILNSFAPVAI
jgi:hypothetical protein